MHSPGFVYFIRRFSDNATKIGIAANIRGRLTSLRAIYRPDVLQLFGALSVQDMLAAEKDAHRLFLDQKLYGEWFLISTEETRSFLSSWQPLPPNIRTTPFSTSACHTAMGLVALRAHLRMDQRRFGNILSLTKPEIFSYENVNRDFSTELLDRLAKLAVDKGRPDLACVFAAGKAIA